jgi:protocatechuate 3,4-dioxygenase beta subunit
MKIALRLILLFCLALGSNAETNTHSPAVYQRQIRVLDSENRPIAGAVLEGTSPQFFGALMPANEQPQWRGITDDKGLVAITTTNRQAIFFVATKPGFSAGWVRWEIKPRDKEAIDQIELTAPASVSGTVKDAEGRAVANALVWAAPAQVKDRFATDEATRFLISMLGSKYLSARTGADGTFKIDGLPQNATLGLTAIKPGLAPEPRPYNGMGLPYHAGQSGINLTMLPCATVEGRLEEETTGAPIAGARVIPLGSYGSKPAKDYPLTGSDGVFRLTDLQPGLVRLRALIESNAFPDWVCEPVNVDAKSGAAVRDVKMTAIRGGGVEVVVQTQTGEPVESVNLFFQGERRAERGGLNASTTFEGLAKSKLPPGQYKVVGNKQGWTFEPGQVTCELGKTNRTTLKGSTSPRLVGIVQNAEGKGEANIMVTAIPSMQQDEIRSDIEGCYSLIFNRQMFSEVPDQTFYIMARDASRNLAGAVEIEVDQPDTNSILKLQPALALTGCVINDQGEPVADAQLRLTLHTSSSECDLNINCATDARGCYEIKGLPPGWRYRIDVSAKGHGGHDRTLAAPAPDVLRVEVEPIELIKAAKRVAGMVLDQSGKAVSGGRVRIGGAAQPSADSSTDDKGMFSFEDVCVGPVFVTAWMRDVRGVTAAKGGDTNVVVRLGVDRPDAAPSAKPRPPFIGTVLDAGGKPAPRIQILRFPPVNGFQGRQVETLTDAKGSFQTSLNLEGNGYRNKSYVVVAVDSTRGLAASANVDDDATNAVFRLEPSWTLPGRVIDSKGAGISNALAQAKFSDPYIPGWFSGPERTDGSGRFEIKGLPQGRAFRVNISADGYSRSACMVEPPDNGKIVVELQVVQLIKADVPLGGVIFDDKGKPVRGASITVSGENQPNFSVRSDRNGRFLFKEVCPGKIDFSANGADGLFANGIAEGGETNLIVRLSNTDAPKDGLPLPTVSGVVLDAAGNPAKNIRVTIIPAGATEKTDSQGRFSVVRVTEIMGIELTEWMVMASAPERNLAASLDLPEGATNMTLRLEPSWTLAGRVTDSDGKGLADASVQLFFSTAQAGLTYLRDPVLTDAEGRYEITGLAPGRPCRLGVNLQGYGRAKMTAEAPKDGILRVDAPPIKLLAADLVVAGVVTDNLKQPVRGASVSSYAEGQDSGRTQSDNLGRFRIKGLTPGSVQISANDSKGRYGNATCNAGDTNIVIQFGGQRRTESMQTKQSLKIPGSVVDEDGKPAPNIRLTVFNGETSGKTTDAEGRFTLALDSGIAYGGAKQFVVLAADPIRDLAGSLDLDEDTTNAAITLEPAWTLAGRVTDTAGAAVTNAQLELNLRAAQFTGPFGTPALSDREGRFVIKGLPRDRSFDVSISAKGYSRARIQTEAPDAGTNRVETDPVQLLAANLTVAGVVLDEKDQPVKGANVYCSGENYSSPERSHRSDTKGRFIIKGICPGRVDISADDSKGNYATVSAEGGDTNVVIRLADRKITPPMSPMPKAKIAGVVADPDGKPASNIGLLIYPQTFSRQTTDSQGRFSMDSFPGSGLGGPRQFVVFSTDPARNMAASADLEEDATHAIVTLQPAWTLAGRVIDADGMAITNAQAELFFQGMQLSALYGPAVAADREGRFEIKGLPKGRSFIVGLSAKGYGRERIRVDAPENGKDRLETEPVKLTAANLTLGGVVLDEKDRPAKSAIVRVNNEGQNGAARMTDRQGRFLFTRVSPGRLQVSANDSNGKSASVTTEGGDNDVILRLVNFRRSLEKNSKSKPKINISVIDAAGKPAPNIKLFFFPYHGEKTTDSQGRISFNANGEGFGMIATQIVALAMDPAGNSACASDMDEKSTNATLKLEPAWILSGRVIGTNAAAVTNAQAHLTIRRDSMVLSVGEPAAVDADGHFEFRGLPYGFGFELSVASRGYARSQLKIEAPEKGKDRVEAEPIHLIAADRMLGGVVLDEKESPLKDIIVQFDSDQQPGNNRLTDRQGRFLFTGVSPGSTKVWASDFTGKYGTAAAQGGDTNIILRLKAAQSDYGFLRTSALKDKLIPDLDALGLDATNIPTKQPLLIVLVDVEQRLSRKAMTALESQAKALQEKGVAVIVLQWGGMSDEAFDKWKIASKFPYPLFSLKENHDKIRMKWGAGALPWFILTDSDHKVMAEGFANEEWARKIATLDGL